MLLKFAVQVDEKLAIHFWKKVSPILILVTSTAAFLTPPPTFAQESSPNMETQLSSGQPMLLLQSELLAAYEEVKRLEGRIKLLESAQEQREQLITHLQEQLVNTVNEASGNRAPLEQKVKDLQKSLADAYGQVDQMMKRIEQEDVQTQKAEESLATLKETYDEQSRELQELQRSLDAKTDELESLQADHAALEEKLQEIVEANNILALEKSALEKVLKETKESQEMQSQDSEVVSAETMEKPPASAGPGQTATSPAIGDQPASSGVAEDLATRDALIAKLTGEVEILRQEIAKRDSQIIHNEIELRSRLFDSQKERDAVISDLRARNAQLENTIRALEMQVNRQGP